MPPVSAKIGSSGYTGVGGIDNGGGGGRRRSGGRPPVDVVGDVSNNNNGNDEEGEGENEFVFADEEGGGPAGGGRIKVVGGRGGYDDDDDSSVDDPTYYVETAAAGRGRRRKRCIALSAALILVSFGAAALVLATRAGKVQWPDLSFVNGGGGGGESETNAPVEPSEPSSEASESGPKNPSRPHAPPIETTPSPTPAYGGESTGLDVGEGEGEGGEDQDVYGGGGEGVQDTTIQDTQDGLEDISALASLWPTMAPAPPFGICSLPLDAPDRMGENPHRRPVFHISTLTTVPEAPPVGTRKDGHTEEEEDGWEYTFSSMDISSDASIVAVGLSDFSAGTKWSVGMVRAYAFSCEDQDWRQLGQDLRGSNVGEQFGHRISSSLDGTVMAISAPQKSFDGGDGFVIAYALDEERNRWERLGQRIDDLSASSSSGSGSINRIGHAMDLSDSGEALAVLGVAARDDGAPASEHEHDTGPGSEPSSGSISVTYTVRVFRFDSDALAWKRRGEDILVAVEYGEQYDIEFAPRLSISSSSLGNGDSPDEDDVVSISDPEFGVVRYLYDGAADAWERRDGNSVSFDDDDYFIVSAGADDSGDVIAFTAIKATPPAAAEGEDQGTDSGEGDGGGGGDGIDEEGGGEDYYYYDGEGMDAYETVKVVDFASGEAREVYSANFTSFEILASSDVAKTGHVVAVVASRMDYDEDEDNGMEGEILPQDMVGALTVLAKMKSDQGENGGGSGDSDSNDMEWGLLGEEGMGVPGSFVTLAGSGKVLAVGSANVVAFYAVDLDDDLQKDVNDKDANGATEEEILIKEEEEEGGGGDGNGGDNDEEDYYYSLYEEGPFDICPPFPEGRVPAYADIEALPEQRERHSPSLASNSDASVIAVGIDSFDGDDLDRGLVRVYGWSCPDDDDVFGTYRQMGQDLIGTDEFDGYGQSVDLSSDGRTLVVGANQPPPGKSGYAEVYRYNETMGMWSILGKRIGGPFKANDGHDEVEASDVGREVQISSDGRTAVALLGSLGPTARRDRDLSYVRVLTFVEHQDGDTDGGGEWEIRGSDLIGSVQYEDDAMLDGGAPRISMSADGGTLAVVGGNAHDFLAKMYDYDAAARSWTENVVAPPQPSFKTEEEELEEEFYESDILARGVALNSDGTEAVVVGMTYGAARDGPFAYVLSRKRDTTTSTSSGTTEGVATGGNNWTLSSVLDSGVTVERREDLTLRSLDVSDDGMTLVVGINSRYFDEEGGGGDGGHNGGGEEGRDRGGMLVASLLDHEEGSDGNGTGTANNDGKNGTIAASTTSTSTPEWKWSKVGGVNGRSPGDMLGSRVCVSGDGTIALASSRKGYVSFFKTDGGAGGGD